MFSGSRGIPEPRSFDAVRQMVRGYFTAAKKQTLPLYEYIREKITKIIRYVQAHGSDKGLTVIKAALGDDVSYADIRLVLAAGIK